MANEDGRRRPSGAQNSAHTPEPGATPVFTHPGRHRIAVLVRHGVVPMELSLVHQMFGRAVSSEGEPLYEVATCAVEPGSVRTDADFPIHVAHGTQALAEADTVLVPATHEPDETETEGRLPGPLRAALARIPPGTRIASICTGAFVLAAAGLLDGRRATTHWMSTDDFRALYPKIDLDPDVLYVDCGSVLTSAGEAAGIDLCLHMIRRDHGAVVANAVARRMVVPPHRDGGQAQFIRRPVPEPRLASTGAARAWALRQLERPITLRELAAQESMSIRTFTRRFREEAGVTPLRWLTQQRVERARQLLEETDLPVERIAADSGFGTAASLRQHLHAALGVSPRAYRRTFRAEPEPEPETEPEPEPEPEGSPVACTSGRGPAVPGAVRS
ncbi:GlxA family transcriptional regulator [Streptomyces axinellae]|uniref:Helix-turn-helix domain-containing protein n=1 Tax=Streptomyces axinellae TaxID=552788 RepID=A0ABN3R0W1_9ACTN